MKKIIIVLVIIIGFFWLVHYLNPTFEDHMTAISPETSFEDKLWDDLEYKDYYIISFTNSKTGAMVSFGFCKYLNVVDDEWVISK